MRSAERGCATLIIWVMFTILVGVVLTSATSAVVMAGSGVAVVMVTLVLAMAAVISTVAVWFGGREQVESRPHLTKSKRSQRERIARLVDSLDDDDIYELETLLLGRDEQVGQRHDRV
jgi:hypothetical protein